MTPLAMADLETALSIFRESLPADVSRVIAASPEGSSQDALRRGSLADTRERRRIGKAGRHTSPSPSSSLTSSSPSPATTDDDENHMQAKVSDENLAVLECPDDLFAGVLDYRSYRLRNRHSTYGASQARKTGQMAKNMNLYFGRTPMFNGKEPLNSFSQPRKFVKACDVNDVSERMGLFLIPNFLSGDTEKQFNRNLPGSDDGGVRGALGIFPAAVNWFLYTDLEPHALGHVQDKFSRATLAVTDGEDAFAVRQRSLTGLCGNIHSEGTMKQQLMQGLPEYPQTDTFVYSTTQRSYQQMSTCVSGKYRAAKNVMELDNRRSAGGSSRQRHTSRGPGGLSANLLGSP